MTGLRCSCGAFVVDECVHLSDGPDGFYAVTERPVADFVHECPCGREFAVIGRRFGELARKSECFCVRHADRGTIHRCAIVAASHKLINVPTLRLNNLKYHRHCRIGPCDKDARWINAAFSVAVYPTIAELGASGLYEAN